MILSKITIRKIKDVVKCILSLPANIRYGTPLNCIIRRHVHLKKTKFQGSNKIYSQTRINMSEFGLGSYCGEYCDFVSCKVGKWTSIGSFVRICSGSHPTKDFVSMHPSFYSVYAGVYKKYAHKQLFFNEHKYAAGGGNNFRVIIGNDVWIGNGVWIMEGITVGDGAVVASGAVVTKDIPPYSIASGVPAKVKRYRFSEEDIDFLLQLKWWDKDESWIRKAAPCFENIVKLKRHCNINE
jgi:acetyltransferase-like isoleucine patch superfamily enzyme